MNVENIIRQLLATRATAVAAVSQIDATLGALEEALAKEADAKPAPEEAKGPNSDPRLCSHPERDREDTTTGGGSARTWFCPHCRHMSTEIAALSEKEAA